MSAKRSLNFFSQVAPYVVSPSFSDYASLTPGSQVLVDCALGVSPLGFPLRQPQATLDTSSYFEYPGAAECEALTRHVTGRFKCVRPEEVLFSTGADATLVGLGRLLSGTRVMGFIPQYLTALMYFESSGARVETHPWPWDQPQEVSARLDDSVAALYLDNPHNPTGSALSLEAMKRIADVCLEKGVLLIADESYGDFLEDQESVLGLPHENIICVRSLSKGCGMAGLRIGYIVLRDPQVRALYRKTEMLFGVSRPSAEVAVHALAELDLDTVRRDMAALKNQVMECLRATERLNVRPTAPTTPIMLVEDQSGADLYDGLLKAGILTAPGRYFHLPPSSVRMRVPRPAQLPLFKELISQRY
jgi:histidinol-phosphate aminotransferase